MSNITKTTLNDTMYYFTNTDWTVTLHINDEERQEQVGLVVEVYDTTEFDEKADADYPFVFSIGIIPHNPSEAHREEGTEGHEGLIYDTICYRGTIPVCHILSSQMCGSGEKMGVAGIVEALGLSPVDCKIITTSHDFGTVAAQQGRGAKTQHLAFASEEKAFEVAEWLINTRGNTLCGMMIGFTLNRPINLIGETGWDVLTESLTYEG